MDSVKTMRKRLHATKGDICVILPGFCVISPLKLCQRTSSSDARIIGVKVCINHKFAIKHQTAVIDSWQRKQISAFNLTMTLWGVARWLHRFSQCLRWIPTVLYMFMCVHAHGKYNRGSLWKVGRKCKSWARFNCYLTCELLPLFYLRA